MGYRTFLIDCIFSFEIWVLFFSWTNLVVYLQRSVFLPVTRIKCVYFYTLLYVVSKCCCVIPSILESSCFHSRIIILSQ
jgi:hypothetical protein